MLESSNTKVMEVIFHAIKILRLFAFRVIYHCTESKDMLAHVLLPIYKYSRLPSIRLSIIWPPYYPA
jgi:hypothetical protein